VKKLVEGLREFQSTYFATHRALFEELAHGQKPRVLFIACSDSRVDPALITSAEMGELFVIRNAGNIIPPYGATNGGEGATIEYAIQSLGIQQVIICGHTHCGAMKGLLKWDEIEGKLPLVHEWLRHAAATRQILLEDYSTYSQEDLLDIAVAENVLTQIENLRTYPVIRAKLHRGSLHLHAWVYQIDTAQVLAYDPDRHSFVSPDQLVDEGGIDEPVPEFVGDGRAPWLTPQQADRIYRGSTP